MGTGHSGIGDVGRPPGGDVVVNGLDMGMGPDHRRDLPVEIHSQGLLLRGGLGMEVNDDQLGVFAQGGDLAFTYLERTVDVLHIGSSLKVQDTDLDITDGVEVGPGTGYSPGKVRRPKEFRLVLEVFENLHAVPDVVSGGLHIDAVGEHLQRHFRGNTETAGGILDIGYAVIDVVFFAQGFNHVSAGLATRPAADIGHIQNCKKCHNKTF